jgi:hypothetical protein
MNLSLFVRLSYTTLCFQVLINVITSNLIPKSLENNNPNAANAVDSDYFLLYRQNSTLPIENIGSGVFAKYNIPAGSIICEFRGPIVAAEVISKMVDNDKVHDTTGPDGLMYKILVDNVCAYVNDCTAALHRPYTVEEWHAVNNSNYGPGVPCIDNFSYNSYPMFQLSGKVFAMSTREILAGEEIFYPYGWQYWKTKMTILKNNKLHKFVDKGDAMELLPVVEESVNL